MSTNGVLVEDVDDETEDTPRLPSRHLLSRANQPALSSQELYHERLHDLSELERAIARLEALPGVAPTSARQLQHLVTRSRAGGLSSTDISARQRFLNEVVT